MVKVLHAADFHLDSAFGALPEEKARLRRRESRGIPARLVEWANDHGAQLMLLAGDLFDSDNLYGQTAQELADALGRFRGRVFIAPGNHDFYAAHGPWDAAAWPENVHMFTSGRPVCVDEPELGCAVWGAAFTAAEEADGSALTAVRCPDDGRTHLMVLHADLSAPDSRYRPITPAQIGETGLSYLALGHTHAFSGVLHAGRTTFAYPGCPEAFAASVPSSINSAHTRILQAASFTDINIIEFFLTAQANIWCITTATYFFEQNFKITITMPITAF